MSRYEWKDWPLTQHSSRGFAQPAATVIHYSGAAPESVSVRWLRMSPGTEASYHVEIARNGTIYKCVPWERSAWHAGNSEIEIAGEMRSRANRWTIGIALSNVGQVKVTEDGEYTFQSGGRDVRYEGIEPVAATLQFDNGTRVTGMWEPYTEEQYRSLNDVLRVLENDGFAVAANTLVGHEEIAMPFGRKTDPGPLFDWPRFKRASGRRTHATQILTVNS